MSGLFLRVLHILTHLLLTAFEEGLLLFLSTNKTEAQNKVRVHMNALSTCYSFCFYFQVIRTAGKHVNQ